MKLPLYLLVLWLLCGSVSMAQAASQQSTDSLAALKRQALKVYLDCRRCDQDYFRTEIPFVNYVIDRKDAQVHILVTSQRTAGEGRKYSFDFIGQHDFTGRNDTLEYIAIEQDTDDITRAGLVQLTTVGLVGYVARTPLADQLDISFKQKIAADVVESKWNHWVFSLEAGGFFNGEQTSNQSEFDGSVSANRITDDWKLRTRYRQNYEEENFFLDDTTESVIRENWNLHGLLVKSMGRHFSAGVSAEAQSSTFRNIARSINFSPAVEYNLFPYSESTRRELRVLYRLGVEDVRYAEITLYDQTAETLFRQSLSLEMEQTQTWGSVDLSLTASNYLHDSQFYRLVLRGFVDVRLFKGLSVRLRGSIERIHDQLSLPAGEGTEEDILLERTLQATDFSYWGNLSLSYTFGSIYDNVVNPRFGF